MEGTRNLLGWPLKNKHVLNSCNRKEGTASKRAEQRGEACPSEREEKPGKWGPYRGRPQTLDTGVCRDIEETLGNERKLSNLERTEILSHMEEESR